MNTNFPLYKPGDKLGMRSSVDPATVSWRLIDNWRVSRNSIQGRLGCDEITSGAILASASFKGCWAGYINGTEYAVVALRASGATRVYKVDTSTGTATELTGASTRFATDGDICFAPFTELGIGDGTNERSDFLYMSNGTADIPRCSKTMNSNSVDFLYNFDLSSIATGTYRPIPAGYVKINDPALITSTVSDADVTIAETGSAPLCEVYVTVGTATDVGDWANIAFGTNSCVNIFGNSETTGDNLNLTRSQQLWVILYDSATDPIHNYANVEVTQDAGQVQIYTASGADRVDPAIINLGGGYYMAGYNLEGALVSTLDEVTGVRYEFARTFGTSRTFRIAGIMAGGRIPQGASYEMSFATMYSRNESAGIVLGAQPTAAISEYGCSRDLPYKLPDAEQFWYQYRIDWGGAIPSSDGTPDATFLYRQEPGDARALFVADMGVANNPFNDSVKSLDRASFRPSPSPGGRGPVSGICAASNNDRLGVGGVFGAKSSIWWSDQNFPLRFKPFPSDEDQDGVPDLDSGLSKSFPGEIVYQIAKMPGSLLGVAPAIVLTSHATYRFEGSDCESLSRPTFLNSHGTIYPRTVCTYGGFLFYLDNDLVVRSSAGGIDTQPISLWKIDDQLENGDMTKACAAVYKERFYLPHRASGATINQRVMVYETQLQEWVRDSYTTAAQNWAGLLTVGSGSTRKLLGFTEEGRLYQLEKAGQLDDDSTAITGTLTTGEVHDGMWDERVWGTVGVVVDAISGTTWDITRTNEYNTSDTGSGPGTINVGASTTRAYRWETNTSTGQDAGIRTPSCRISISGKVVNAKFLKSIVMKVSKEVTVPKGDRS